MPKQIRKNMFQIKAAPYENIPLHSFMKTLLLSLFIALGLLLTPSHAQAAAWQADFRIRVYSPKVKTIVYEGKLYLKGLKARIEPADLKEIDLYDFETGTEIRIFPEDGIYFRKPLSLAKQVKAAKEGWGPMPHTFHEKKILLREGRFKGQAARLYFIMIERKAQTAYMMRWMTDEPSPRPLRAIYSGSGRETIIVDFELTQNTVLNDDLFKPPTHYLSLSPF